MYQLQLTSQFKRDLKKIKKKKVDFDLVRRVLRLLQLKGFSGIPRRMKPHRLSGKYSDCWECHIKPDLLIIWIQQEAPGIIKLVRIGSHSELFR